MYTKDPVISAVILDTFTKITGYLLLSRPVSNTLTVTDAFPVISLFLQTSQSQQVLYTATKPSVI